jgi:hypothetical protein
MRVAAQPQQINRSFVSFSARYTASARSCPSAARALPERCPSAARALPERCPSAARALPERRLQRRLAANACGPCPNVVLCELALRPVVGETDRRSGSGRLRRRTTDDSRRDGHIRAGEETEPGCDDAADA